MLIALLVILGVDLIVFVALMGLVLGRSRWLRAQRIRSEPARGAA